MMGRSVSTPNGARHVLYVDWYPDEITLKEMVDDFIDANEIEDVCRHDLGAIEQQVIEYEWDYIGSEDILYNVLDRFPTLTPLRNTWAGKEDRVLAGNDLAWVGVSEYCGVMALWIMVNPNIEERYVGLAERWIDQMWPTIEGMYPNSLDKVGTMSNGESVYFRK